MKLHIVIFVSLLSVAFADVDKGVFKKEIVSEHNKKRDGEPAKNMKKIKWSAKLAKFGQDWAENCKFAHGQPRGAKGPIGQNLYASWGRKVDDIGKTAVDAWFNEKSDYHFQSMKCNPGKMCGHYTQVVWAESTEVGCGYAHCPDGMDIVVCNYLPAGNYIGRHPYKI